MFRTLLVNTLVSALAYFVVSVVGLLLIPMLVSAYGLTEFGLIVLVRLLLPTGILGPFDWGLSETATQAVAQARSDGLWRPVRIRLHQLLAIGGGVGALLGLGLFAGAEVLASAFRVDAGHRDAFAALVRATALCMPLVFAAQVWEGVVKGAEDYRRLRTVEVVAALVNAVCSVAAVWAAAPYTVVAYGFLASLLVRALLAAMLARRVLAGRPADGAGWLRADWRELWQRCRLMALNRTLGTLQAQAAPLLCGTLLGPAAAGLYDVLVRLPRFAKQILGLLNSALLPVAARLEASADTAGMHRIGRAGVLVAAVVALPPLMAGAAWSEPILRLWLGPALAAEWLWQALMFAVPAFTAVIGAGATALLVRPACVAAMNRLVGVQIVLQLGFSFLLLAHWGERAFVAGQVAAMALTFWPQLRLICREQQLEADTVRTLLAVIATSAALTLVPAHALGWPAAVASLPALAAIIGANLLLCWAVLALWLLPREWLRLLVRSPGRRRPSVMATGK